MRLLDTQANPLRIVEVPCPEFPEIPPYVILSHTWGPQEVTLQDMQESTETAQRKKGYEKIRGCCTKAAQDGYRFAWIDTCCIDKTNSVELSEAINSMYQWYRDASICYAFLVDVPTRWAVVDMFRPNNFDQHRYLKDSRWFLRGWTLQELIAPDIVEFYAKDWTFIGSKSSLRSELASITGISDDVLGGDSHFKRSVAERMSWAAARTTERMEDEAYCLLGIFDVNMPLICGEGRKAFLRLQEEILKRSEDYTILAWVLGIISSPGPSTGYQRCNPLADAVSRFQTSSQFQYSSLEIDRAGLYSGANLRDNPPPSMTGRGLFVSLPLSRFIENSPHPYLAYIGCRIGGKSVCIPLERRDEYSGNIFNRLAGQNDYYFLSPEETDSFKMTPLYITQRKDDAAPKGRRHKFSGEYSSVIFQDFEHCSVWMTSHPDIRSSRLFVPWSDSDTPYHFLPCITDDREAFVVILSRDGGSIVPFTLPESITTPTAATTVRRGESTEAILRDGFWGWRQSILTPAEISWLLQRHEEGRDHTTLYFANCAVSMVYKRRPYAFDVEMSTWSTVPSEFRRRQMEDLVAEYGDGDAAVSHDTPSPETPLTKGRPL